MPQAADPAAVRQLQELLPGVSRERVEKALAAAKHDVRWGTAGSTAYLFLAFRGDE